MRLEPPQATANPGGFRTPMNHTKPNPTGTKLIRLADIPLPIRRKAALQLMNEAKDTSEYAKLFELVYAPGNASGRIAA